MGFASRKVAAFLAGMVVGIVVGGCSVFGPGIGASVYCRTAPWDPPARRHLLVGRPGRGWSAGRQVQGRHADPLLVGTLTVPNRHAGSRGVGTPTLTDFGRGLHIRRVCGGGPRPGKKKGKETSYG